MTLYEFNRLSETDQLGAVWEQSNFVVNRRQGPYLLNLYAIDTFWVEVHYHPGQNQITGCRGFRSINALEPYLSLFTLPDFLSCGPDSTLKLNTPVVHPLNQNAI
ncbi:MAG: hypothetical protein JWP57_1938 [Spirosoma sp.]|nr:hypothetical protein [Spirosoma sp.]